MLSTKLFEVRDRATFIVIMATRLMIEWSNIHHDGKIDLQETWLLHRVGLGHEGSYQILMTRIEYGESSLDSDYWVSKTGARTLTVAHQYIEQNFLKLKSGNVIDVEFILGETQTAKKSERENV